MSSAPLRPTCSNPIIGLDGATAPIQASVYAEPHTCVHIPANGLCRIEDKQIRCASNTCRGGRGVRASLCHTLIFPCVSFLSDPVTTRHHISFTAGKRL